MRICDLRQKEVINVGDCQRIGYVCDMIFDLQCGKIESIIIAGPCKMFGFIGRDNEFVISLDCVCGVGEDVIFVQIKQEECLRKLE